MTKVRIIEARINQHDSDDCEVFHGMKMFDLLRNIVALERIGEESGQLMKKCEAVVKFPELFLLWGCRVTMGNNSSNSKSDV